MENKNSWKRFRRLKFDAKSLSKRARRAETLTTKHAHKFVLGRMSSLRNARSNIINWLAVVTILIAAVAVQQMWNRSSYTSTAAVSGGTYAEGMIGPFETLNPLYVQSSAEVSAARLIFSGLFDYDKTGNLRGDLAESVTVDPTGKIYTVKLRPNVRWHDGQKLTADDVVFTINTMKNPAARATMYSSWQNIVAKADSLETVRFTLPNPYASFKHALTFSVLPKHSLDSIDVGSLRENQFSLSPIGTGPFSLRSLQTSRTVGGDKKVVQLKAFEDHHRGEPKLANFQIHSYPESEDILKAMRTREINAALDINEIYDRIPKGFETESRPVNSGVYAQFNNDTAVLKDVSVRRALQHATNTTKLRESLGFESKQLDTPILASQVPSVDLPNSPKYDIESAKQLLDQSGWLVNPNDGVRSKEGQPLELRVASIKDREFKKVVNQLRNQWKDLGVKVIYTEFDPKASPQSFLQTVLQPRTYDVLINQLVLGADPDVFAYWHSSQANPSGLNFSNYRNLTSDDALLSARIRDEQNLRDQKYKAFTAQWIADAPAIGLYQSVVVYAHTPVTKSIDKDSIMPTVTDRYSNILYWSAGTTQVYKTP